MNSLRRICTGAMGAVIGVTSLIVIPLAAAGPAAAAGTSCTPDAGYTSCVRYTYTGADDSFTVPAGVTAVRAKLWGAGGGGVEPFPMDEHAGGGSGGFTTATLAVTPNSPLSVMVGEGGQGDGQSATSTYGGGGAGGVSWDLFFGGGSGGGMSALFSDSTNATPLLIAGGGGGAAGTSDFPGYFNQDDIGGGGGGGLAGTDAATPYDGGPGTQLAGGAGGTATDVGCDIAATAGSQNSGGTGGGKVASTPEYTAGGGGGGGYFGGGGGACSDNETQQQNSNGGPGGGGSGYIASTGVSDADILAGSSAVGVFTNAASAGANDSLYDAGTGQGGSFQNGGNGEIVLEWVDGPTASAVTSTGTGTASQSPTITVPDGGSLRLLDADSNPVTSLVVPDEGTYTVDTDTNVISFVPASSFHGTATPVNYRLTDSSSRTSDSTYTPTVTLPAAPTLTPITSSGGFGATQTKPVTIPDGDSLHLLSDATPVTTLAVAGQGTYSVNPTTGVVTFTPVAGFSGVADPVTLRLTDAYGQSSDASFTATVLANAPQAVASVTAPAVMKVVTQAQTFPVICKLTVRKAGHCDVTLVYQNTKGRYVIGTASVSSAQAGGTAGQLLTNVTLNATGHYLAYLGPIPTWVYASITPYGSHSAIPAVTRTVVENYNLK